MTRFLLFLACFGIFIPSGLSAPGDVDLSFDSGSSVDYTVYGILRQPDGKILIRGDFTTVKDLARFRLARLNADGTGDPTFVPNLPAKAQVSSFLLQPDGKIVVGEAFPLTTPFVEGTIERFNPDGSRDDSFTLQGTNGVIGSVYRVLQSFTDGKILAAGYYAPEEASKVVRFDTNGVLDTTFTIIALKGRVWASEVQSDGEILIGGDFSVAAAPGKTNVIRITRDGALDNGFAPNIPATVRQLGLQPDGKILVAAELSSSSAIYRLMGDGAPDAAFHPPGALFFALQTDGRLVAAGDGKVLRLNSDGSIDTSISLGAGWVECVSIQPDGSTVIGGNFNEVGGVGRLNLARLNLDFSVDATFNSAAGANGVRVVALQPDEKVLIGGTFTRVSELKRPALARLNRNGSLDLSFNPDIRLFVVQPQPAFEGSSTVVSQSQLVERPPTVRNVAARSDGKIVIGGDFTRVSGLTRRSLAVLNSDGSLDTNSPVGTGDRFDAFALQPDDKMVIGGGESPVVLRLDVDGNTDPTFSPPAITDVRLIKVQSDGKIMIAGYYSIVRLNPDGRIDSTFAATPISCGNIGAIDVQSDGKLVIGFVSRCPDVNDLYRLLPIGGVDSSFASALPDTAVWSVFVQPDDKILAGYDPSGSSNHTALVRLNSNGTVDPTFEVGVGARHPYNEHPAITSIARQRDGRIIIGGAFTSFNGIARMNVARLEGDSPVLSVSTGPLGQFILQWPMQWTGFELEQAEDGFSGWQPASANVTFGPINHTAEIASSRNAQFFRLRKTSQ